MSHGWGGGQEFDLDSLLILLLSSSSSITIITIICIICNSYSPSQINRCMIVKSGTDFRTLSKLTIEIGCHSNHVEVEKLEVTSEIEEDPEVKEVVEQFKGMWCIFKMCLKMVIRAVALSNCCKRGGVSVG